MTRGRLFLVHWDGVESAQVAASLEKDGWQVDVEFKDGAEAVRRINAAPPDAAVVYLNRLPSHGREVVLAMKKSTRSRDVPVLMVGGSEDVIEKTRAKIRDAEYLGEPSLKRTLARFATPTQP